MANATYGNVIYADTVGIISKTPVRIMGIEVDPSAVDGLVLFNYWDEGNANADSHLWLTATAATGVVTDDDSATQNILTTAAFPAGDVVKVIQGSGATANHTYHLIGTAGDNDHFHVTPTSTWADEASKTYEIISYPARRAIGIATRHVDLCNEWRYYGEHGIAFPNLILATATNAVATLYLAPL